MKRWSRRLLLIAAGTVLASGAALLYSCWKDPVGAAKLQDSLQDAWLQLRAERVAERAGDEIERLGSHAWAGTYRSAYGMWGDDLLLAPGAGFATHHNSMCGNGQRWIGYGRIRELGSRELELNAGIAAEADYFGSSGRLLLVPWDDFLFAVPAARIESFCAQAAGRGRFPSFPFRETSSTGLIPAKLPGLPEVPERYAHLLSAGFPSR